jgi:pyruvate kinase
MTMATVPMLPALLSPEAGKTASAREADPHYRNAVDASRPELEASIADVICHALHHAASVLPVKAIVTYTTSGSTSLRAAFALCGASTR